MQKTEKIFISLFVSMTILLGIIAFASQAQKGNVGSVQDGSAYAYYDVTSAQASSTVATRVRGGTGVLGSVIIASSSLKVISIYDGNTATTSGNTLIAQFPAFAPAGTYTFDVVVKSGIVVDVPASMTGNYTITYR